MLANTGGGGEHFWLWLPKGAKLADGLDLQSDGRYVIAPPSLHIPGKPYAWDAAARLGDLKIADAPSG